MKSSEDTTAPSSSPDSSRYTMAPSSFSDDEIEISSRRHKSSERRRGEVKSRGDGSSRRAEEKKGRRRERERKKKRERRDRDRKHRRSQREGKRKLSDPELDSESESKTASAGDEDSEPRIEKPQGVTRHILAKFPGVAPDLEQLLQMIDSGQAVDLSGLSDRYFVKHLKKLFRSLNLKEIRNDQTFLLPPKVRPTLEIVGSIIHLQSESKRQESGHLECKQNVEENRNETVDAPRRRTIGPEMPSAETFDAPRRKTIGPEMPSAELLAAAAKLTEAEAELREAEVDDGTDQFIGPPPPALVAEAESANEAERFEEVGRIMGVEEGSPYDVLGVNRNMSADNIKKRYWKLSLIVHPDKCCHPQAQQAFVKLNQAWKDLQDPDKRKGLDEKIRLKEEQEEFKAELKAMREAAQWRRLQGVSMEGDDALLADMDMKVEPKRDEWMTTLPPERKPGVTAQSTRFSKTAKGERGDTGIWTDTPLERSQKVKMNYLEAYNETAALASKEQEKKRRNSDAELVDQYNKVKRSKSLVEKHQESARSSSKGKSKQESAKGEWEGQHPWKPWDREKDLTAGRKTIKFDAENMSGGLTSRFSSGSFQRNFL